MRVLIASTVKRRIGKDVTASRSRIIYEIASGLVRKGHEVSLIGTADSFIDGVTLIPVINSGFNEMSGFENKFYAEASYVVALSKKLEEIANEYEIVHNHTYPEFVNLLIADRIKPPMVTTIHAQATPELDNVLSLFPNANLVSISKAHKNMFKKTKIQNVVYNGIDTSVYSFEKEKENYLLWIGRLSGAKDKDNLYIDPKGILWAIKLAQQTGERLVITGAVEDIEFFEKEVKSKFNDKIQWIGPISKEQKVERTEIVRLMQKAKAFLMTVNWEEPFGLVMAEAMSCGTPVIGFNHGAVSEVIAEGKTGFVVNPESGIDGLRSALEKIETINPADCRKRVEELFSIEKMIDGYEDIYKKLLTG